MSESTPNLLIITPVFNESAGLQAYYEKVKATLLARDDMQVQVLFVEDGSSDDSWSIIRTLCERDSRLKAIRLSRNFGSHIALSAGFAHVNDAVDAVATLACDLQDPPETILEFVDAWRGGAQIVWGRRRHREDDLWRRIASSIFSRMIGKFAMPKGSQFTTGSFFLVDAEVAHSINQFPERNRITFALVAWTGFQQATVHYDRLPRTTGRSGWSFGAMIKAMYDTFVGFSMAPVRLITFLGVFFFFISVGLSTYVVYSWLIGDPVPGWSGIMFALSTLMGIQFFVLGVIGEYLYRIYSEVVRRPLYFVQARIHIDAPGPDDQRI